MRALLKIFRNEWRGMGAAVLLGGASLGAAVGLLATSAWLISMASTEPPVLVLEVAIVSVRFFGLSRGVLRYASRLLEHDSALKLQTTIRIKIYESFREALPTSFFTVRRGNFLSQVVEDVELAQDLWLRIASPWLSGVISGVCGVTIIHWLLPACGDVVALIFLLAVFLIPFLATLSGVKPAVFMNDQEEGNKGYEALLFEQVMQIAESTPEALVFGYDQLLVSQIEHEQAKISKMERDNAAQSGLASASYYLLLGVTIFLSLSFAAHGALTHHLAGINVAVITLLPLAIFDGLSGLPNAFSQLPLIMGAVRNISPMLNSETSNPDQYAQLNEIASLSLIGLKPQFDGDTHIDTPSITATINRGETVVVSGRSGAGKSSIVHALVGLMPHTGSIMINEEVVDSLNFDDVATMLQDDYLFGTSIRENLKIGSPSATDEGLLEVLEIVELREFVERLPSGLDTVVGSLGYNFSGGEKQRFKLARVLLRNAPIFILDEPYEFLDSSQVTRISTRIDQFLSDRIVLIVSHLPLNIKAVTISL